jgi:anti-sigma regulatory factor (Ser/Thr protein kinase)
LLNFTYLMVIDARNATALRHSILTGRELPATIATSARFTLSGLFEAVATVSANRENAAIAMILPTWLATDCFEKAWRAWSRGNVQEQADIHGVRRWEFHAMQTREDQTGTEFQLFQERLVRSLKAAGVTRDLAYAYAGALAEMSDNVVQHSEDEGKASFSGLAGYHVEAGYFAFSVVDVGRGILSSLRSSSKWSKLETPEQALRAAVCDSATRRPQQKIGDGFREVFRSMADRNCHLRFRSDNSVLLFSDAGDSRIANYLACSPIQGFHVSCVSSLDGNQGEKEL